MRKRCSAVAARCAAVAALLMSAAAAGAASPAPASLPVDIVYTDAKTKKKEKISGELVASAGIPIKAGGKDTALSLLDMIPSSAEPRMIKRLDKDTFSVSTFRGETKFAMPFAAIPVRATEAEELAKAMMEGFQQEIGDELAGNAPAAPPAVALAVDHKLDIEKIDVKAIESIAFHPPVGGKAAEPSGRYVAYSKKQKGSDGAVKVDAATFFGGKGDEAFVGGAFLKDGSILAAGTFSELGFTQAPVTVAGKDPPVAEGAAEPPLNGPVGLQSTVVLARYAADATKLTEITRWPWGSATVTQMQKSPGGGVFVAGAALGHFRLLAAGRLEAVEPQGPAKAGPQGVAGSYVAKLTDDGRKVEWAVLFKERAGARFAFRTGNELLVELGRSQYLIAADGKPTFLFTRQGFREGRTIPLAVSPIDNMMYLGGEYNSGTGREPYRNPFVHKIDPTGRCVFTGWNWGGPMVGTDFFRQVSDSSPRHIKFARNGDAVIVGWSDGGNSVWTNVPYDLTRHHGKYKFLSDMSAASVGSFAHVLRVDTSTFDVKAGTMWIAYHPTLNKPNSSSINDMVELADGRWMLAGGSAFGLIETPDAWVTPWVVAQAKDPNTARPHGGAHVAVLSEDFAQMHFCSLTPAVKNPKLATHGTRVLLVGAAANHDKSYGMDEKTIVKNPAQAEFGGGATDAYLMLIDAGGGK